MGCLLGAYLLKGGGEVWFLDVWQEQVDALNTRGLTLIDLEGEAVTFKARAAQKPDKRMANPDLIIIMVKAYHTEQAALQAREIVGDRSRVLTLQNGLGNGDILGEFFPAEIIFLGTTALGAHMLEPGKVKQAGRGETVIGRLTGGSDDRLHLLVRDFQQAGLKVRESEAIETLIWDKLMVNVGINALTALLRVSNGRLVEKEETRRLLRLLVEEAQAVACSAGIELSHPDPVAHVEEVARATADNYSSMYQDVSKGAKTEVAVINGAIVKKGHECGRETPYNEMITLLVNSLAEN